MLILASDGGPNDVYTVLETIKRKYIHSNPCIDAYFYKADPTLEEEYKIVGDIVYVKTEETYPYLWKKFLLVLKAFENRLGDYDFICRPNLSTFIIIDRYIKHVETLPKNRSCSGVVYYCGQPSPFPAGYCFTLSSDLAKDMIYNDVVKDNHGIDDRCVGFVLKKLEVPITRVGLIEINNFAHQETAMKEELANENNFMVRVRHFTESSTDRFGFGIDTVNRLVDDLSVHHTLLEMFYKEYMDVRV